MRPLPPRTGFTLIELLVVIALLAIIAAVATPALRRVAPPDPANPRIALRDARRTALKTGQSVTIAVMAADSTIHLLTAHPDGSVVADSILKVDRLTARFSDDTR